jgi:hypothetical protein
MKLYYEAVDTSSEEEGEFVRLDVTDYTDKERAEILAALKDLMGDCTYYAHTCGHDEMASCVSVNI